jgi:hypothetical protein
MRLNEFTKALTEPEKHDYAAQIWAMINHTYKDLGLPHAGINELLHSVGLWEVEIEDNKVIAGVLYRNFHGSKLRLIFHDSTFEGKTAVKALVKKKIVNSRGYWGEFSNPLENVILKMNGEMIPNTEAEKILDQKIDRLDDDGYHYYRFIDGQLRRKVLIGHPNV